MLHNLKFVFSVLKRALKEQLCYKDRKNTATGAFRYGAKEIVAIIPQTSASPAAVAEVCNKQYRH